MSIRYTLRHLKGADCNIDNLKNYELAVDTTNIGLKFRFGDVIYDLTGQAGTGAIETSRAWAVSEGSPDDASDSRSPTGKTMSARSWALAMIDDVNQALTQVGQTEQSINQKINIVNQKITDANTLLNRLIDITDADEVRY